MKMESSLSVPTEGAILEFSRILHGRGHDVSLASLSNQEQIALPCSFISSLHIIDPEAILRKGSLRSAAWTRHKSSCRLLKGESKTVDVESLETIWRKTHKDLRELVKKETPDLILFDWQDEPALDYLGAVCTPIAILWPQTVHPPDLQPSKQHQNWMYPLEGLATLWRSTFHMNHLRAAESAPEEQIAPPGPILREASVASAKVPTAVSGRISFVNLKCSDQTPPSLELVGPVFAETYPSLTGELTDFLDTHKRVLYVTLGSQATISAFKINQIVYGITEALEKAYIDGVIWSTRSLDPAKSFFDIFEDLLNNQNPRWRFHPFIPQRAILAHPSTRLFLSNCGTASVNEAIYHGVPILGLDIDHPLNLQHAESAGIARALPHTNVLAAEICRYVGDMVQDVYGVLHRNVDYMQKLAIDNSARKELAVDFLERMLQAVTTM